MITLFHSETIDASHIHSGLWQGAYPPTGTILKELGFSLVILCAQEYQPPASQFPGVRVCYAPNVDDFDYQPSRETLNTTIKAANLVVEFLKQKKLVLVTCWAGVNRSSLVSALALHKFLGISGSDACALIQSKRYTLTNPQFIKCLSKLPAHVNDPKVPGPYFLSPLLRHLSKDQEFYQLYSP